MHGSDRERGARAGRASKQAGMQMDPLQRPTAAGGRSLSSQTAGRAGAKRARDDSGQPANGNRPQRRGGTTRVPCRRRRGGPRRIGSKCKPWTAGKAGPAARRDAGGGRGCWAAAL
ncbi:hypothetical protein Rsub_03402 [Raphidocelis subcapitata]|uniref:Uncharacterized protein n=1 Tax=Raphidocelis subcapitata TaxID=307507 RepID=A0A2V0NRZ8_9CHLO|nr:hypothetical protein Rsub_03402 [Raphidocelis subcapitata]|eukprot:GBF90406.1 hypothetical protein Rsub_03402 [Raphidocelis subcapitata]